MPSDAVSPPLVVVVVQEPVSVQPAEELPTADVTLAHGAGGEPRPFERLDDVARCEVVGVDPAGVAKQLDHLVAVEPLGALGGVLEQPRSNQSLRVSLRLPEFPRMTSDPADVRGERH